MFQTNDNNYKHYYSIIVWTKTKQKYSNQARERIPIGKMWGTVIPRISTPLRHCMNHMHAWKENVYYQCVDEVNRLSSGRQCQGQDGL